MIRPDVSIEAAEAVDRPLHPEVSIVIPVMNQIEMTTQCLAHIGKHTERNRYELIVINNGSKDGTRRYLDEAQNVTTLHCSRNIGVGPAWNLGVSHSRGAYICVINNDIVVTPNWVDNLLWPFSAEPDVWCSGPVFTRGPLPKRFAELAEMVGASSPQLVQGGIVGFCFVLNRSAIDKIGTFDEQFETAWFEDTDYYCRLLEAGHPPALAVNCLIHHYETKTARKELRNANEILLKNQARFKRKWGRTIDPGTDVVYTLPAGSVVLRGPAPGVCLQTE